MKNSIGRTFRVFVTVFLLAAIQAPGAPAAAGESAKPDPRFVNKLADVNSKGYVPVWLVCGPFSTGVQGGMTGMVVAQKAELTTIDYLAPAGGEAGIEPAPGMEVDRGGGKTNVWRPFPAESHRLDAGMKIKAPEGVIYAAAYIESDREALLLVDMETVTGLAIWMNHELVRRSHAGGLGEVGKERVLVSLEPGVNLLLVKFAGIQLERAAEILQQPISVVRHYVRGVSAELAETTGMAASVRAYPLLRVGKSEIAVQTGLQPTGYFHGTAAEPSMEFSLTVANGGDARAENIKITVASKKMKSKVERTVALDPKSNTTLLIPLPVKRGSAGGAADAAITASVGRESVTFDSGFTVAGDIPASDQEIYIIPGFHADPVWIEDQRDYSVSLLGSAQQNMYLTGVDPNYGVYMSELDYLKPFYDAYPEFREPLKQQIKEGRVGTGGSYSQPVEKMISGEALVRNLLYGKLFHENVLGDRPRVYMGWDIFGHVAQLSQILAKTRNDGAMWSKGIIGFPPLFWHESLDGTRLLHKRMAYGSDTKNIDGLRNTAYQAFQEFKSYGLNYDSRLDASDFKPPTPFYAGNTGMLRSLLPGIHVTGGGGNRFFSGVLKDIREGRGKDIPVTTRDMSYYHQGTALSRVDLKIGNRLAENAVQNAEKFAALANLMGLPYPDKLLDKAWRQLLFGQHHDALTGTINDRSFLDLVDGYRESIELSTSVTESALDHIGGLIDTAGGKAGKEAVPVAVFNPLAWERTDVARARVSFPQPLSGFRLTDAAGVNIPFEFEAFEKDVSDNITGAAILFSATIPSLGYATYYIVPAGEFPREAVRGSGAVRDDGGKKVVTTERYRATLDPAKGGGLTSLFDLENGKELIKPENGVGNDIVAIKENSGRHEPPWEIYTIGDNRFASDNPATVEYIEGPVTSEVIVKGKVGVTETERHIIFYRGLPRIDFETYLIDYQGHNNFDNEVFVVTFPVDVKNSVPVFEERYGAVVKKKSRRKLVFQTWQMNNYSDHGMMAAHQWMDESYSVKVEFTNQDGKTVSSYPVGMVAMVTDHNPQAVLAAQSLQSALVKKGIHSTPWFDDYDRGRLASIPHSDTTMPDDLNKDLPYGTSFRISLNSGKNNLFTEKTFKAADPAAVAAFEKRVADNGYGWLFLMDPATPAGWAPVPLLVVKGADDAKLAEAVKLMAESVAVRSAVSLPGESNAAPPSPGPDNYGVGLLNLGNLLNSVENDDTLAMFLVHTASFFRRLPYELVPESKTNAFSYALYPHAGNWREGRTYRAGFEFNNPFSARQLTMHEGKLPAAGMAFLSVEPENLVVTAVKPAGNPTAGFSSEPADAARGLTVRLYEAEGKPAAGTVNLAGGIAEAWSANLLEEKAGKLPLKDGVLRTDVGPFSIETYVVKPASKKPAAAAPGLPEAEPAQPVFARFWMHNAGAAPIGNLPVSVVIQGNVKTGIHIEQGGVTINEVFVTVTNDYTDKAVSGAAVVEVPDDWRALPDRFEYSIEPGGHQTRKIVICFMGNGRAGLIKARVEHGGQTIEDVIEIGSFRLPFDVVRNGDMVTAKIGNPHPQTINGVLSAIGPVETWGRDLAGGFGVSLVSPRLQRISLQPGEEKTFEFRITPEVDGVKPATWLTLKLAYNGRVEYKPVQ